jgi:hypothetical protein
MEPVTGVFPSAESARRAYADLKRTGFSPDRINLLAPGASEQQIHSIPTSETEQPGMGATVGSVVGAALGIAGGFELGTIAATAIIPGVGPVLAAGAAAAGLLGLAGSAGGAALGAAVEESTTPGLPADEIFFYEDALRQGRSVVIAMADGDEEAERARQILAQAGAESLDAAREAWWIGLRDAEAEHHRSQGFDFEQHHEMYRAGFQAALRREFRGKTYDDVIHELSALTPSQYDSDAFRGGFERGQAYLEERQRGVAGSVWYGG